LSFNSAVPEPNEVTLERSGVDYVVTDDGAPPTAGFGCVAVTASGATCLSSAITDIALQLGPGNDTAACGAGVPPDVRIRMSGGPGDDVLAAGEGSRNDLYGDEGNDRLEGGNSGDFL